MQIIGDNDQGSGARLEVAVPGERVAGEVDARFKRI
jgi:FKBP-type peptidyl-prolyl cis-trans isomerase (trigger factor)